MRKILIFLAVLIVTGCKTHEKVVTVTQLHTDTIWQKQVVRDSVRVHDSVYVKEWMRGDTVFVDRAVWHTAIQDRLRVDTVYKSRVDSVPVPYPVERLVERQLTWWQKARMKGGEVLIGILAGAAGFGLWRLKRRLT